MQQLCPNVCLVWMGQTPNMFLLVNAVVSPKNTIKKLQNCIFFSYYCALFTIFHEMCQQKLCRNYLGTKSTFKGAQKLTLNQFCSKNALHEAMFWKNSKFLTHAIFMSFLSCFWY